MDSSAAPAEARAPRRRHRRRRRSVPSTPMVSPPRPAPSHPPTHLTPAAGTFGGRVILNRPIYGTVAAGSKHEGALKSCHLFLFTRHDTALVQPGGGCRLYGGGCRLYEGADLRVGHDRGAVRVRDFRRATMRSVEDFYENEKKG